MKKFDVEITETLQRKVSVEAASQEDAERMVTQAWNNQDYVLDSGDFTGVNFKTVGEYELAETRTMDVLLVQPNAYPKKISVGTELEDLQAMVGGDIEVTYPFENEVAIILNESGKINGLPMNRAIYTEDGDMLHYRERFHVDAVTAAKDLQELGVNYTQEQLDQIKRAEEQRLRQRRMEREAKERERLAELYEECDDRFAFIAGYTDGGTPYGVMWEEVGIDPRLPFEEKVKFYHMQMLP
nr:DpnD/PcfM family protein [Butyricicoccus sp. AF86-03b2A]